MDPVEQACAVLERGGLVVVPTDTVYGVAASLRSDAIDALFAAKGRPRRKALPVLGANVDQLRDIARFSSMAEKLARAFWPGPLTMVLPRVASFTIDLGGVAGDTVAVRVPLDPATLRLIEASGPLAVTSANASGEPPATTIEMATVALGGAAEPYVDAGPLEGEPSTILELFEEPTILRDGPVSADALEEVLGIRPRR